MVWVSGDGEVERMELDLLNVGVPRASIGDLVGGDAEVVREVVFGQSDPIRDIVVLNAAAAWSRMANRLVSLKVRLGDGVRGRYGGLGGVSGCDGFRVSVRARERDRQLGDLSPGL
jgi:hypothetical protein